MFLMPSTGVSQIKRGRSSRTTPKGERAMATESKIVWSDPGQQAAVEADALQPVASQGAGDSPDFGDGAVGIAFLHMKDHLVARSQCRGIVRIADPALQRDIGARLIGQEVQAPDPRQRKSLPRRMAFRSSPDLGPVGDDILAVPDPEGIAGASQVPMKPEEVLAPFRTGQVLRILAEDDVQQPLREVLDHTARLRA